MYLYFVVVVIGIIGFCICRKNSNKEWQKSFLVCLAVAVFSLLTGTVRQTDNVLSEEGHLARQPAGEGEYQVELLLGVDGNKERDFIVTVPERKMSSDEELYYLNAAVEEIEQEFLDSNLSLERVCSQVKIREAYQNNLVSAIWEFSNPMLIGTDGKINEDVLKTESEIVYAAVTLSCGNSRILHNIGFSVYACEKSEEEELDEKIYAIILENGRIAGTDILQLPKEVEGRALSWKAKESKLPRQILLLGILIAMLLPALEYEKRQEQKKKREEQLLQEYPEMISKFVLLLGAGMTVLGAWNKITDMYLVARKDGKTLRNEIYEEMLITRHEIESGRGEIRAYEAFGERCALPRFRKFTNYLVQNMKKGSVRICELLEKEAQEVFGERRNRVRRYGEEATTKLLLPMLLMLGIVIFIIMVPAIISFQVGS